VIRAMSGPTTIRCSRSSTLNARFTVAELLRNGITTFVEFGSQLRVQQALLEVVGELGIRAYLGPGFDSGRWVGGAGGKLVRVVDEASGEREFDLALEFIDRTQGKHGDLVRGILVPREIETCTVPLMRKAATVAQERDLPVAIHAAYNIHEVFDIIREHQMTAVELLRDVGPDVGQAQYRPRQLHLRQPADELFRFA